MHSLRSWKTTISELVHTLNNIFMAELQSKFTTHFYLHAASLKRTVGLGAEDRISRWGK